MEAGEVKSAARKHVLGLVDQEMDRLASRIDSKRRIGLGKSEEAKGDELAYDRLRKWRDGEIGKPSDRKGSNA